MAYQNAFAQYRNSKIMTASPAELTLMLYEGAIKFSGLAIMAIEQKDIVKAHNNIIKTERIIEYLKMTLDTRYPVSKDFDQIYTYLESRLTEANVKKDIAILEEIRDHLRGIRDIWKDIMQAHREKGVV
jgi:flagellar protein FliS